MHNLKKKIRSFIERFCSLGWKTLYLYKHNYPCKIEMYMWWSLPQLNFVKEGVPDLLFSWCSPHSLSSPLLNVTASIPSPKCLFSPYFLPVVLAVATLKSTRTASKSTKIEGISLNHMSLWLTLLASLSQ